jgi:crotonobetainyl-CoA:carnitine CoA-transferase CaiB-like acyl-CoA transferase
MGPLSGITVVDLGQFIAGPYAALLLGELGADVIKVEPPGQGDPFRIWAGERLSTSFVTFNRGKRSVALDLKNETDRADFLRLVATADVLVENYRAGVTKRLGIDYATLQPLNPRLIYCSITGFGTDGPYVHRPSYDTVAQGLSGLSYQLMEPTDPRLRGPGFADVVTGQTAAFNVLGALVSRGTSGQGQLVQISMLHALVHFLSGAVHQYVMDGRDATAASRPRQAQAYAFTAGDEKLFLIHLSSPPKFWQGLCRAVGRDDLLQDARFAKVRDRVANYEELRAILQEVFATRPRQHWLEALVAADVPCAAINTMSEVLADPQVEHLGIVVVRDDDVLGRLPFLLPPGNYATTPTAALGRAPLLGEHNAEVLGRLAPAVSSP